jgi:phage gp36-like protein
MPYSTVDDLLLGDLQTSRTLDKEQFVNDAADEIDSTIGSRYKVPIATANGTVAAHSLLLLKRLNNHIATGRLILAVAAPNEQATLHAYGKDLLKNALEVLCKIRDGEVIIEGAEASDSLSTGVLGPVGINADAYSAVDTFEQFVMGGASYYPPLWQPGS